LSELNPEGLTWEEWAYAAGVEEPLTRLVGLPSDRYDPQTNTWVPVAPARTRHGFRGYAHLFRKERKAWREGEDPTEWRAAKRHTVA